MSIFRRRPSPQVRMQLVVAGRDVTIEGALLSSRVDRDGVYRLADATVIEDRARTHSVGTVAIPHGNVLFWQEVASLSTRGIDEIVERSA